MVMESLVELQHVDFQTTSVEVVVGNTDDSTLGDWVTPVCVCTTG